MSDARPDILRGAADVVRKGGLARGWFFNDTGRHCTVGALCAANGVTLTRQVVPDITSVMPEINLLADMLGESRAQQLAVYTWNDTPERTADDVITLLEQAAEKAAADR